MGLMKTTGRKVDYKKEGRWRKPRPSDNKFKAKLVLEYAGEVYSVREFIKKFCPNANYKKFLANKYPPAEMIVRYNATHKPVHMPDVDYVWSDLEKYNQRPTKKHLIKLARQARSKGLNKKTIPRKLIV